MAAAAAVLHCWSVLHCNTYELRERVLELPLPPLCVVFFFSSFYPFKQCSMFRFACMYDRLPSCFHFNSSTYYILRLVHGVLHTHTHAFILGALWRICFFLPFTWSRCHFGMFLLGTLNWAWIPSVISSYFIWFNSTYQPFMHWIFFLLHFSLWFLF